MKKILLLGGSFQQLVAIKKAQKLGYYVVLCDYLPDNPGRIIADRFYLESTTEKEKILDIATKEKIDGILAYASDPAAPTAAYVAEKLGLPTNPFISVNTLCNKDMFRSFLKANGFQVPKTITFYESFTLEALNSFSFPIIIKPVDSSGSKGVTVVNNVADLNKAYSNALRFSRSKKVIAEEFIKKNHKYLIGGDIFIVNGKIIIWGLLNCYRDANVNPLVPVGKSFPICVTKEQEQIIKKTLDDLVKKMNLKNGAMNVELIVDSKNRCYIIDAGPRAGGNMIPILLSKIYKLDMVEMALKCSMGEEIHIKNVFPSNYYFASHNLHSSRNGILKRIDFDETISKYIVEKHLYKKPGDEIEFFDDASKAIGIIIMRFVNTDEQSILDDIYAHVKIVLANDE